MLGKIPGPVLACGFFSATYLPNPYTLDTCSAVLAMP
jgi:hypothetical protein